jgi:hypothetical protein
VRGRRRKVSTYRGRGRERKLSGKQNKTSERYSTRALCTAKFAARGSKLGIKISSEKQEFAETGKKERQIIELNHLAISLGRCNFERGEVLESNFYFFRLNN